VEAVRQGLVRLLGGKALADLASRLEHGDHGDTAQRWYLAVRGRKRLIGYLLYAAGFASAATASALGCSGEAVLAGCALVISASQGITWAGWGLMQLGILDHSARRRPEGLPAELAGAAGQQTLILGLVWGTAVVAQQLGVPAEVCRVFVDDVATLTLIQIGLIAPGAAAGISAPEARPIHGRGPR